MRRLIAIGVVAPALACATPTAAQRAAGPRGDPGQFFGPDSYPPTAVRAGEEGRVVAQLWIDRFGKVASCTVNTSSGSVALDQATCSIALGKVTFTPATNRRGEPIAASYILPVRWVLPTDSTPAEASGITPDQIVEVTVSVDSSGEVLACNVVATPKLTGAARACDEFPVGSKSEFRWSRDGRAVGETVVRTIRERIAIDP